MSSIHGAGFKSSLPQVAKAKQKNHSPAGEENAQASLLAQATKIPPFQPGQNINITKPGLNITG